MSSRGFNCLYGQKYPTFSLGSTKSKLCNCSIMMPAMAEFFYTYTVCGITFRACKSQPWIFIYPLYYWLAHMITDPKKMKWIHVSSPNLFCSILLNALDANHHPPCSLSSSNHYGWFNAFVVTVPALILKFRLEFHPLLQDLHSVLITSMIQRSEWVVNSHKHHY